MTTFDRRERAFEDKFAHDDTMIFKARARRNRLFGEWLGTELGMSGETLKAYAADVVKADLEEEGDGDILRKVRADIDAAGLDISDHKLDKQLTEFMCVAKGQIASGE